MAALKGALPAIVGAANAAGGGDLQVDRSLRFNSSDSAYLSKTFGSGGLSSAFTLSFWVKKYKTGDNYYLFSTATGEKLFFDNSERLVWSGGGSSAAGYFTSLDLFRDSSAWIHLVFAFDYTKTDGGDRMKLYKNGVDISSRLDNYSAPSTGSSFGKGEEHNISKEVGASNYGDFGLAEINFIVGQQLNQFSFGSFDNNNNWNPKSFSGAYGTNGFRLAFDDFSSASALGTDSSGNGNNFTVNNLINEPSILGKPVGGNYDSEASTYSTSGTIVQETGQTLPYTAAHYDGNVLRSNPSVATGGVKIVTTNPAYQEFFMSAWIKFDALQDKQMGVDLQGGYIYWEMLSSGKVKIRHTGGSGVESGSVVLTNNTWHHCALSRSGNTLYGFVDGVVVVSTTSGVPSGGDSIGANENWWFFFNPYETGFRMLDVCIFAGQGRSSNFTAPTGPLIGSDGSITNPASLPDTYRVYASPMIGFGDNYDTDSVLDTPTNYEAESGNNGGNYATLDAAVRIYSTNGGVAESGSYSNGNLTTTGQNQWSLGMSSIAIPSSGKWYCEMRGDGQSNVGIASFCETLDGTIRDSTTSNAVWYAFDGKVWSRYSGQGSTTSVATGLAAWQNGATLGIAVNVDDGEINFYVNNSWNA